MDDRRPDTRPELEPEDWLNEDEFCVPTVGDKASPRHWMYWFTLREREAQDDE